MEDSTITIGIDLHYFMDDDQRHEMDASIHNKCEASMIQVLTHIAAVFDEKLKDSYRNPRFGQFSAT